MSVKKLICNEVARCQPASLRKKLFHASSFMYFTLIFSECFTITSSKEALKVCTHNFIQRNVVLLVIYLFHHDSSKSLSSRQEVFCEKGVLRNFTKFAGKHLCQSLFFNKVAGLRPQAKLAFFSKVVNPLLQNTNGSYFGFSQQQTFLS